METSAPPQPTIDISTHLYHQIVYTLTDLLPPPLDNTPEALRARNHAAIAKVAALLPVNANEADLAAQCIAARAQAEDILRLLRHHKNDIALVIRLNAQYASMVRTSLSVEGRLMRVQTSRRKREANEATATQDAWAQHVAEQSMAKVIAPNAAPQEAPPVQPTNKISKTKKNSHDTAFETRLSAQRQDQTPEPPDDDGLLKAMRKALANARLATHQPPANSHESPARAA